jgi:protein ImuB
MTFVCLWIPDWSTAAASTAEAPALDRLTEALLHVAPRVAISAPGLLWADARGLPERALAEALCAVVRKQVGAGVQAAVAQTPIAAEVAARHPSSDCHLPAEISQDAHIPAATAAVAEAEVVTLVPPGKDREFLAPYPLVVLRDVAKVDPRLLPLLAGLGIEVCGDLAALGREEVEVRCGADGIKLWRLARAEDRRRPFGAFPRTLPRASCAWTDYALRDGERLLFVIHRLVAQVCDALQARGEGARALALRFALADRTVVDHTLRAARATADRAAWLRLIRRDLENLRFTDAVTGITVRVDGAAALPDCQGDIFDRGFTTARATEQAVAQLLDACGMETLSLTVTDHPLLERRTQWQAQEPVTMEGWGPKRESSSRSPSLTVQLFSSPRKVRVMTTVRRDHDVPVRYHDGEVAVDLLVAMGPDRVGGGSWEGTPYTRDYFQCVTASGRLVLLFRSGQEWFLHGWWD